jgi:ABC-type microcin C transport system permease subunit YejB
MSDVDLTNIGQIIMAPVIIAYLFLLLYVLYDACSEFLDWFVNREVKPDVSPVFDAYDTRKGHVYSSTKTMADGTVVTITVKHSVKNYDTDYVKRWWGDK